MAIDSRAKRLRMLAFSDGGLLPDPSGTVGATARAAFLWLYLVPATAEFAGVIFHKLFVPIGVNRIKVRRWR